MIATIAANRSHNPLQNATLIVAPLALLDQWQMEIEMKTNLNLQCLIYHGTCIFPQICCMYSFLWTRQ